MFSKGDIKNLTEKEASHELTRLAELITDHDIKYYQNDAPTISDSEYDKLRFHNDTLEKAFPHLIRDNSPNKRIGAPPQSGFSKIKHSVPMLSLGNAFNENDVYEFTSRIRRFLKLSDYQELDLVGEPKIDGLSISLRYEGRNFLYGATRGDGHVGENVTSNLRTIKEIPITLPASAPEILEVRGEIYMSHQDFTELNIKRKKVGESVFSNPRNAAAGSLRQLDPGITSERALRFFAYSWGEISDATFQSQFEFVQKLQEWGFPVNSEIRLCTHPEELIRLYTELSKKRPSLGYDIDGVVYKIDQIDYQKRLGFVSRSPRWAIAHKFPAEKAETIIFGIDIQVGRTGSLTPVARLKPTTVGGVVVANASLHNEDYIAEKDIRIGDTVTIQRAGDVIPQILEVSIKHRDSENIQYVFPKTCPECGSIAIREDGQAVRRCSGGLICPAQRLEKLKHLVSRQAFDIDGLGGKYIEALIEDNFVERPGDIFRLKWQRGALLIRNGWGEQSVKNLLFAIEAKRRLRLDRFIYALGIPQIGVATSRLLAQTYVTYKDWRQAMENASFERRITPHETQNPELIGQYFSELCAVDTIGMVIADELARFFNEENNENTKILDDLVSEIQIEDVVLDNTVNSALAGKTIVFSGSLNAMTRQEAKSRAETLGAKVSSSVSKKTDLLIVGTGGGGKVNAAKTLGVPIASEDEWIKLASI